MICYLFFFFQAEDGIRDGHVTGVQTCALPISHAQTTSSASRDAHVSAAPTGTATTRRDGSWLRSAASAARMEAPVRSEERRVGKECRRRGETCQCNIK